MIVYCIDISGSMDTQFEGKSRLAAVKEAIRDEIKRMKF
jgi:Mg-chelatase subunit ChlD